MKDEKKNDQLKKDKNDKQDSEKDKKQSKAEKLVRKNIYNIYLFILIVRRRFRIQKKHRRYGRWIIFRRLRFTNK